MLAARETKKWSTPLTIGAFILMAVTGILMFLHQSTGLNKVAHEWVGIIFVVGALVHVWSNFPALTTHLKKPKRLAVIALFTVILGLTFISTGDAPAAGRGDNAIMAKLANAPISQLAQLADKPEAQVLELLQSNGIAISSGDQSIADSTGDLRAGMQALSIVFADPVTQ